MLRGLKSLYGKRLGASDGEIGQVKDFYFDDQKWVVRYIVVDTASWLPGREVLIAPHAFGHFYLDGDRLLVNLTRHQIENSPPTDAHKPISRQYEEDYYRYYGWPSYWDGSDMWGTGAFPVVPVPDSGKTLPAKSGSPSRRGRDSHLRSTKAVDGYRIQTAEKRLGHAVDFIINDENWAISQMVVETGHWLSGSEKVISPDHIESISYVESSIIVREGGEAFQAAAEYLPSTAERDYHDTKNFD